LVELTKPTKPLFEKEPMAGFSLENEPTKLTKPPGHIPWKLRKDLLIALDDHRTWPSFIVKKILSSSDPLRDRDLLAQILEEALPHDIVGFHATRLHRVHIDERRSGKKPLAPLSPEDERARVYDLVRFGDLSSEEAKELLATSRAHESCRKGFLGLYFTEKIFERDSCYCFFRYWGGESLGQYGFHEKILRKIGIPCVVEVKVPIKFVHTWISGKDFVNAYTQIHKEIYIDDRMYGCVDNSECPVTVLNVIEFGSDRFSRMTSKVVWREPIHP